MWLHAQPLAETSPPSFSCRRWFLPADLSIRATDGDDEGRRMPPHLVARDPERRQEQFERFYLDPAGISAKPLDPGKRRADVDLAFQALAFVRHDKCAGND